jgi:hypothetical protein
MVYMARSNLSSANINTPETEGGWGLIDITAKCQALLLSKMWLLSTRVGTSTATYLQAWDLAGTQANPPHPGRLPKKLAYLQIYAIQMAYVATPGKEETPRRIKRRMYDTLHFMEVAERGSRESSHTYQSDDELAMRKA